MRAATLALVAALAVTASASIIPFTARQVVPEDAIGTYIGANFGPSGCPFRVTHTATVNADEDPLTIPHSAIEHNRGAKCSPGKMTVYLTPEAAMNAVSSEDSKSFITNFADAGEPAIYGVEEEGRKCGNTEFGAGSVIILFAPTETFELSNREAFPGGQRYMLIDDPSTPGTCRYAAPARTESTPTPSEAPTPGPGDGPGVGGGAGSGPRDPPGGPDETPAETTDDGSGPGGVPIGGIGGRPGGSGDGDGSGGAGGDGATGGTGTGTGIATGGVSPTDTEEPSLSPSVEAEDGEDGDDDDDDSVCFPSDAEVEIEDGSIKKISDVQIGDRVKVADGVYSDVFMFTHKDASTVHEFVSLYTASGNKISATKGHYLYINGNFAAAMSAKVGDVLELGNGARTTISRISTENKTGLFNPQTIHGDIIVNSVRASTFTRTIEPSTAQALLAPLRMMYDVVGLSASFLNNGADSVAALLPKGQLYL